MKRMRKINIVLYGLCLMSCTIKQESIAYVEIEQSGKEVEITTAKEELPSVPQVPINIYEYDFAYLPFMEVNIEGKTLKTSEDFPQVLVEYDYCLEYREPSGFEGWRKCLYVDNALYETISDYTKYLFEPHEYEGTYSKEWFDMDNILEHTKAIPSQIDGNRIIDIISRASKIVEMPCYINVVYKSLFDLSGYNRIIIYNEEYQYLFEIFEDYFILSIQELDETKNYYKVSYTYFESKEMMLYLKELLNS